MIMLSYFFSTLIFELVNVIGLSPNFGHVDILGCCSILSHSYYDLFNLYGVIELVTPILLIILAFCLISDRVCHW